MAALAFVGSTTRTCGLRQIALPHNAIYFDDGEKSGLGACPGFPRYSSLHSTLSGGVFSHLIESVIPEARPLQALVTALSIAALRDPEAAVRQMVCPS